MKLRPHAKILLMAFGALVAVGAFWWNEHRYDVPPPALPLGHDLKITVTASRSIVSPEEEFSLDLRVQNITDHTLKYRGTVWSWLYGWQFDSKLIGLQLMVPSANPVVDFTIAPGAVYDATANASVSRSAGSGQLRFKMYFTPPGSAYTYVSNEVELLVH